MKNNSLLKYIILGVIILAIVSIILIWLGKKRKKDKEKIIEEIEKKLTPFDYDLWISKASPEIHDHLAKIKDDKEKLKFYRNKAKKIYKARWGILGIKLGDIEPEITAAIKSMKSQLDIALLCMAYLEHTKKDLWSDLKERLTKKELKEIINYIEKLPIM